MRYKTQLDINFAVVSFFFLLISIWFYFVQGSFIHSDSFLSPLYRTLSHDGKEHLIRNAITLVITGSFLSLFVTYRYFLLLFSLSTMGSIIYYNTYSFMVGFSVVTSSLMGGVVAIFIINSYILISKDRYVDSRMEYISFNSGSINTNKMSTRILLFYQFSVFIFSFMTRGSDYLMRLNLLQRDPEFIPNILLHGGQSVDSYVVINAHLFGFFIGLIISVIIMNWILIVKRKEYENRIKNSINI